MGKWACIGVVSIGLALASCGGDAPGDPEPQVAVRDSAGVSIVESRAPRAAPGTVLIDSIPVVSIGREESGPYLFGFISDVAFLDDGTIAVAEVQSGEIRVFDTTGEHEFTLGGQGEGPGEFRTPALVAEFGPDSLVGYDARLRRTTIFPRSGGMPRTLPNSVDGNFSVFGTAGRGPLLLYSPGGGYRPDLDPGGQWVETPVIAMDSNSGASDTIATLPDRWRIVDPDGNAPMPQPLLYAVHAVASDGFYWGTPDSYEVSKYDWSGRLQRIIRREAEPQPVEPAMLEAYVDARLEEARQRQGDEAVPPLRERLEGDDYLDELPYFSAGFVDREDRLWLGTFEWPDPSGPVSWSVFDSTGAWIWDVMSPTGLRLVDATADLVLAVAQDPLGVPSVQVHELRVPDPAN